MDRACLVSIMTVVLVFGPAACGGGGRSEDDAGLDADAEPDLYEVVELENPCQLPPGVEPDPQWGAEVNPTGHPIGGSRGYGNLIDPAGAHFTVATGPELLAALASATAGQVVYIDEGAEIDLTGEQRLEIPGGVTLASGRGRDGSPGALIYTTQWGEDVLPLFLAAGESVRLTGLRLQGPDPEIGDHDYETDYRLSRGIQSNYPLFEVDNCELWGWSHAAVFVAEGSTSAFIHHNSIHHNRRTGLGYGVCLGYSTEEEPIDVLIEGNLFDYCRHHIASTGNAFSSYEARYNMVLEHANGSNFDRHGTVDPGTWVGGTGGDWTIVHHNTVRFTDSRSVGIRGIPVFAAEVYRNWFYHANRDDAVWFFEEESNTDVYSEYENFFGPLPPPGTYLPTATASASPPMGRAPLTITFDGSASCDPDGAIVSYHWDFGDGAEAEGELATYTFGAAGRYNVTLTVTDDAGIPVKDMIPVTVHPSGSTYVLDFWVKDGYRGTRQDFYTKQALLDGLVVWEDDVAENEGWEHVSLDVSAQVEGRESVDLEFRVISENAVTDPETQLIELDVYWDDVILFGGTVPNGDFEQAGGWTFTESADDTPWGGRSRSGEVRSGDKAFWITHPYNTASTAGTWGQLGQIVPLGDPEIRGRWLLDEAGGSMAEDSSMYGNHAALVNMDEESSRVDGAMGRGLRFDGTDDYLDCGSHASLTSAAGSLELWMSSDAEDGPMDLLFLFEDETQNYLLVERDGSGSIRVVIEEDDAARVDLTSSTPVPADGQFHHLAVTQDGSGVRIFMDGEESAAAGANSGIWTDHLVLSGAWIGRGSGAFFSGNLDNVVVYARALTADEIRSRHESVRPRGLWHLDEAGGAAATDDSGFGNHGTLMNMDPLACWIDGVQGSALAFDGIDDLVDCGSDASLHLAGDMTIEMWVRFDSFVENEQVLGNNLYRIFHRGDWAGDRLYFLMRIAEQQSAGDSAWDYWSGVATSTYLVAGWWYHVAAVREGEAMSLYLNGEKESEINCLSGVTVDDSGVRELVFGGEPFSGAVDEVALYPRALSAGEIMQHYEGG